MNKVQSSKLKVKNLNSKFKTTCSCSPCESRDCSANVGVQSLLRKFLLIWKYQQKVLKCIEPVYFTGLMNQAPTFRRILLTGALMTIFLSLWFSGALVHPVWAEPKKVSSEALIENSGLYDGKVILYEGEAIGEVMLRGDYGWINVSDGTNAIGVWAKKEDLSKITYCGSYKFRGDKILIEGVFNRSCSLHPGELDIHAKKIKVLKKGEEIYHPLNLQKIKLSLLTALLALSLFALTHFLKRK